MAGSKDGIGVVGWKKQVLTAYFELRASVGLALAPEEPSVAATAILRIEALAAEFSQNRSACAASAKQKTRHVRLSRSAVSPARTERKPTAEFMDDVVVLAHDPIGMQAPPGTAIHGRSCA